MPSRISAGVLVYRRGDGGALEVFLVHPGGPYFRNKDLGWWTIPKGEPEVVDPDEAALIATARRELTEETGLVAGDALLPLGSVKQKGGKVVYAWAVEGDLPEGWTLESDTFELEWPPRSGRLQRFPEVDQGRFFDLAEARARINAAQEGLLDRLEAALGPRR